MTTLSGRRRLDRREPRYRAECLAAGQEMIGALRDPGSGARNEAWAHEAGRALRLVAWGGGDVESAAVEAARRLKRGRSEARRSARWARGQEKPPGLPDAGFQRYVAGRSHDEIGATRPAPPQKPPPAVAPIRQRPPAREVARLWECAGPVTGDAEVSAWVDSRGIDPCVVADRDLARVLRKDATLPGWARFRGQSWASGYRCLFRAWGPTGRLESIRARWVGANAPPDGFAKAAAAAAGPGSATGLILADGLGRQLLALGALPDWWPPLPLRICVSEGEPDWLTWATRFADSALEAPALLGIWAGAWTQDVADRIPASAEVLVRTDLDPSGASYAKRVVASLAGRCTTRLLVGGADDARA